MVAGAGGACGSGSRMSAPSPRPSAFLGIGNDLLGEMHVTLRPFAMNIVKDDWFSKTWRFGQAHIARNYTFENLCSKETAQVRGNLLRKCGAVVVHCKQDAFDFETRIQGAPNPHQGIQKFGHALKSQIFALNRYEDGSSSD